MAKDPKDTANAAIAKIALLIMKVDLAGKIPGMAEAKRDAVSAVQRMQMLLR